METTLPPDTERLEKPTKAQIFEHMFPGSKFDDLAQLNPSNIPSIIKWCGWEGSVAIDHAVDAFKAEEGYASRHDISSPDQLTILTALLDINDISQESPSRFRGWIRDLLKEGEDLGGMGVRMVGYIPSERKNEYSQLALSPRTMLSPKSTNQRLSGLFDHFMVREMGVLGADGKPKAIISFMEGLRPRYGEPVRNAAFLGNLATASSKT